MDWKTIYLTSSGPDALTNEIIHEKLNNQYEDNDYNNKETKTIEEAPMA